MLSSWCTLLPPHELRICLLVVNIAGVLQQTFEGFERSGGRGTGTRNYVVLFALTSLSSSFVRALEKQLQPDAASSTDYCDGIVACAHTEGGKEDASAQHIELLLRTLAGFVVHPNVGGALVVDGGGVISNQQLQDYLTAGGYPIDHVPIEYLQTSGNWEQDLASGAETVQQMLPRVCAVTRSAAGASALTLAQQCGGSDAFSGISSNPLIGEVSRLLVQQGG